LCDRVRSSGPGERQPQIDAVRVTNADVSVTVDVELEAKIAEAVAAR
jgi:hypothetical protein